MTGQPYERDGITHANDPHVDEFGTDQPTGYGVPIGNDHFIAAERLLTHVRDTESGSPQEAGTLAEAQVHATLALVWAMRRVAELEQLAREMFACIDDANYPPVEHIERWRATLAAG